MTGLNTIKRLLTKFSPSQLEEIVPMSMDINWETILELVRKYKLCGQKKYLVDITMAIYERSKPAKENILELARMLKLYEVVVSDKLQWNCIRLQEQLAPVPTVERIENCIRRAYKKEAKNAEVLLYEHDDLCFILVTERLITKYGMKFAKPVFFVINLNLEDQYAFYHPPNCSIKEKEYICEALGFSTHSHVPLCGSDVAHMFDAIKREPEAMEEDIPEFMPIVLYNDRVTDFRLGDQRLKYANSVLPGLTNYNEFIVHGKNEWRAPEVIDDFSNERFLTSLKFSCKRKKTNVEEIFKEMIHIGMVTFPLPSYIMNLSRIARNKVGIENVDESDYGF